MQVVFLENGTKAKLITKTDKGFVVDPIKIYQDFGSADYYEEPSGNVKMVDKIYEKPPVEAVEDECKQILQEIEGLEGVLKEKTSELTRAKFELGQIERQKTDLGKMIINRWELVNAKRLIVWVNGCIAPRVMDVKNSLKLTVSYTISQYGKTEEKCWAYSTWSEYSGDDRWSTYSECFDPEYGIKADLTDDEILQITHDRQTRAGKGFDDREIERCHEKWLTPQNVEKKHALIEKSKGNEIRYAEQELIKAQEKVNKLKGLTVS